MTVPDLLTVQQVAHMVGAHANLVYKAIGSGRLAAYNIGTAESPQYRISEQQVMDWLEHPVRPGVVVSLDERRTG